MFTKFNYSFKEIELSCYEERQRSYSKNKVIVTLPENLQGARGSKGHKTAHPRETVVHKNVPVRTTWSGSLVPS